MMSKDKFERTKPVVNVGTIGHVDHGKAKLTAAVITAIAANLARKSVDDVNEKLTRKYSVNTIKVAMPQTILRKHNIQRAQYLYNDSIGIELQVLERNNASRKRDIVKNAVTNFTIGCFVNKL